MATRTTDRPPWAVRERQVDFPPLQKHLRVFELGFLVLNVVLIAVVLIVLWVHPSGAFLGPWG